MGISLPGFFIGLLPVGAFLGGLVYLDSFRLVGMRSVLLAMGAGCLAAVLAFPANTILLDATGFGVREYSRYIAPFIEEGLKASYVFVLLFRRRVGFMVDAAIYGFAIGTGFSFVENIFYLQELQTGNLLVWAVRGFGTALMHGGTTAMLGVIAKEVQERNRASIAIPIVSGMAIAVVIHSVYNHFFFSPSVSALLTIVGIPLVMLVVYRRSERNTRDWLGVGFDTDRELLEMISTGVLSENRVGQYLQSLEAAFPGPVVADLLCYLRLYVELAIKAKAVLLMREAGIELPPDPEVQDQFKELQFLEKTIGKTGLLALHPFIHTSSNDLWQLQLVKA